MPTDTLDPRPDGQIAATMADASHSTINIPQILAVALVGFLAIRWFMSKPSSPSSSSNTSTSSSSNRPDLAKIEHIAAMFPQLDRRTIAWDLHRNGSSVPATTERILSGRGLDAPPPSYQPNLPSPSQQAPAVGVSEKKDGKGKGDLITRYGLQSRVGGKGKAAVVSEEERKKRDGWSSDKAARAEGLRRRREEMILEARRRLEEKEGQGGQA